MSSLLQFSGDIRAGKVGLLFYPVIKSSEWDKYHGPEAYKPCPDATTFCDPAEYCEWEGRKFIQLYRAWRKPVGTWGHWVVFRYNGGEHLPDLSVPISILRLPRDAEKLSAEACANYWKG